MPVKDWVVVGTVVKPHGITGELSVACHADSPEIFGRVPAVSLRGKDGSVVQRRVRSWRMNKDRVLLRLEGLEDRTRAEGLRGADIAVRTADLPRPAAGERYLHQLEGCRVFLPDGAELGVIQGFLEAPGQEIWVIRALGGEEVLFPAVRQFVRRVDLDQSQVVIDPPEGLLELYLGSGSQE